MYFDEIIHAYVTFLVDSHLTDDPFVPGAGNMCAIAASVRAEKEDVDTAISTNARLLTRAVEAHLQEEEVEARPAKVKAQNIEERRVFCLV